MWLMSFHLFLAVEDVFIVCIENFLSVALGNGLVGVDDDETEPNKGVYFFLGQPSLQLAEDFRSIDDVHFDEIPF